VQWGTNTLSGTKVAKASYIRCQTEIPLQVE